MSTTPTLKAKIMNEKTYEVKRIPYINYKTFLNQEEDSLIVQKKGWRGT